MGFQLRVAPPWSDFIGNFTRLYDAQDAGNAYETPLALETAAWIGGR